LLNINRPEEKINPRRADGDNQTADDHWPRIQKHDAAHGLSYFFLQGTVRLHSFVTDYRILTKKQLHKVFFITPSRPQLYKSFSVNQMISKIIDNNGRDDKKELIFLQKAI